MLVEKQKSNLIFYGIVFTTGMAILIIEILGARIIATNYGNTVYVWSAIISTTIVSLAIGYWLGGKLNSISKPLAVASASLLLPLSVMTGNLDIGITQSFGVIGGAMLSSMILFSPFLILVSTTSPYIIKQITNNLKAVGKNSGNVFAIGTIGSFIGAVATGFILIPSLPITYIILITMGIIGILSMILSKSKIDKIITISAIIVGITMTATIPTADAYVYETESLYSNLKVMDDDNNNRSLLVDNSLQSIVSMGDGQSQVPFSHHMELAYFVNPSIEDVLVIGLGSGKVSEKLELELGSNVDTVEIDDKIIGIAETYFGFSGNVIVDDGRHYIKSTDNRYDAIFYDVATGDSFPPHLFSNEAFGEAKSVLTTNGIITIHLDGDLDGKKLGSIYKTLDNNFENVFILNGGDSILSAKVFFATDSEMNISNMLDQVEYSRHLSGMKYTYDSIIQNRLVYDLDNGIILTDNYNPMDLWQAESSETWREYSWEIYS